MNELDTAKLIIQVGSNVAGRLVRPEGSQSGVDASYVMTTSIMKINPQYFSIEALAAIGRNEVELIRQLKELDEDVTLNELIVSMFNKKEFH